jgi:hypothetical protein
MIRNLAATLLLFLFALGNSQAQFVVSKKQARLDKLTIDRYLHELNKDLVLDEIQNEGMAVDTAEIDSLISESKSQYNEGKVMYAPDGKFKIYSFQGESCVAHCSNFQTAYIQLPGAKRIVDDNMLRVKKIFKLADGKYLILQGGVTGGGEVWFDNLRATLVAIKGNKLICFPFSYIDPITRTNTKNNESDTSLHLLQETGLAVGSKQSDNNILLRFDPKTNLLYYRYTTGFDAGGKRVKYYTFSGYFRYRGGQFVHQKETKVGLNVS